MDNIKVCDPLNSVFDKYFQNLSNDATTSVHCLTDSGNSCNKKQKVLRTLVILLPKI